MKLTHFFQQKNKKPAFIPFIMAGHPNLKATFDCIIALEKIGADAIEIGIPFSDPVADGPINQKAAEVALSQGVHLLQCLELIQQTRLLGCTIPIIVFTYFNPILRMGLDTFVAHASKANIDAVLVVDLPPEESKELYLLLKEQHIDMVFLASPTTDPKRFIHYQTYPPVFLYYVSRLGVTGMQQDLSKSLQQELEHLREQLTLPICVGFGISSPQQAHEVAQLCDGVIVGSALVHEIEKSGISSFIELAKQLREAIKS